VSGVAITSSVSLVGDTAGAYGEDSVFGALFAKRALTPEARLFAFGAMGKDEIK